MRKRKKGGNPFGGSSQKDVETEEMGAAPDVSDVLALLEATEKGAEQAARRQRALERRNNDRCVC